MANNKEFCFNIKLQSHSSEVNRLFNFIQESMGHALIQGRADEKFIHDLKLVTEEWFANIINHGSLIMKLVKLKLNWSLLRTESV